MYIWLLTKRNIVRRINYLLGGNCDNVYIHSSSQRAFYREISFIDSLKTFIPCFLREYGDINRISNSCVYPRWMGRMLYNQVEFLVQHGFLKSSSRSASSGKNIKNPPKYTIGISEVTEKGKMFIGGKIYGGLSANIGASGAEIGAVVGVENNA